MNFTENHPFSYLERVFPIKALPYLFFPQEGCLSDKKGKIYARNSQEIPTFVFELFDCIVPQNAEIRMVTKSLLLNFKNSAKSLLLNRLS